MARKKLTDAKIADLKPKAKRYIVPDSECPGLYIRVMPTGSKSFTIVARDPYAKQLWREVEGATVGVDELDDVREKARAAIKRIKAGADPFPPPPPKPESFKAIAENYLERRVRANGLRSAAEIERCIKVYVYPTWADRSFAEIKRSDVTKLLDVVEKENGPRQADLVLAIVRGIMNWHATRDDDYVSPIVRGMARTKPADRKRERILSDDEIRQIWPLLGTRGSFGALLKLALLTGQRRDKVLTMQWADISEDGVWTIPTEAREKGNPTSLHLPKSVLAIVRAQIRIEGNLYVFPGRGAGHINGFSASKRALDKTLAESKPMEPWVIHDLRRTARSLLSRAGVSVDVAERVLGHVIGGVRGVYDRHSYEAEKRVALNKLAATIERILNPPADNVRALARRRTGHI